MDEKIMKSPKNRALLLIILIGVAFAVLAGFGVHSYLSPKRTTYWCFNSDYKAGTALTEDMLYAVQADAGILVAGAGQQASAQFITGAEKAAIVNSGDSLRIDVTTGMPLMKGMLSVNGGTAIEMSMDPAKVCVTLPCTSITGVSDGLTKGSRVNVYATGYSESGTTATTLIFQAMKVADTGIRDGVLQSITLETTVEESLKLINYQNSATLYFGLVDQNGYQYAEDGLSYSANLPDTKKVN